MNCHKPVILVCGKTGAGKSSLIRAVTPSGTVPDDAIGEGKPVTQGLVFYKTENAVFVDSEGMVLGQTISEYQQFLVSEIVSQTGSETDGKISQVWYCIDGAGMRLQGADKEILSFFGDDALLVVTKSELLNKKQFAELHDEIKKTIPMNRVVMTSSATQMGLERLMELTISHVATHLPNDQQSRFKEELHKAYAERFAEWQEVCDKKADEYILWAAARAAALTIIPIPLTDAIPLSINEFYLYTKVFALYGHLDWKNVLMSLGYTSMATFIGRFIVIRIFTTILPIPILKSAVASSMTFMTGNLLKHVARSLKKPTKEELKNTVKSAKKDWEEKKKLLAQIPVEAPQ